MLADDGAKFRKIPVALGTEKNEATKMVVSLNVQPRARRDSNSQPSDP